jgi:diguanylate cyclase (GGDEF)-like protein
MSVLGMLAWLAAAASLWLGGRRHSAASARGYRWLAGAAGLYCAALIIAQGLGPALSPDSGLSFADLPSLLAVAAAAVGIWTLATAETGRGRATAARGNDGTPLAAQPALAAPGLADGYVAAVALLVIGWITLFSSEFHRSGERPGTFLLALVHPLADLAVLGVLLPLVTSSWRRVLLPYAALLAVLAGDALAVGQRAQGGGPGVAAQLLALVAALLLAAAPWLVPDRMSWAGPAPSPAAATIVAALTAAVAAVVVIVNGWPAGSVSGDALLVVSGAGVLALAARVFMLARQNAMILGIWQESSHSLRELASRTSDVVLVCDTGGAISYASPAVGDYGYSPGELSGQRLLDFVHPEDRMAVLAACRLALGSGRARTAGRTDPDPAAGAGAGSSAQAGPPAAAGTLAAGPASSTGRFPARVRAADGTWRHVESTVLGYQVPGQQGQILVTARDVSDQMALRQQVAHLTFHDGLTGLPNRAYLEERARDLMRDGTSARPIGIVFLDLDRFTAVNDSVGHGAGDLVLAQTARRLRAAAPVHDTVARWGSDEFAVLVENAGSAPEVAEIARRLVGAIAAEPFRVAGQQVALTASAGVAITTRGAETPDHDGPAGLVLRNADVAMSRAREAGGGRVETYAEYMHADVVRRLEIVTSLQRAINDGELTLHYQPVVDLATSRVIAAEALVRWWRGDVVVPPREFLGAAEDSGLIVPLGEWVLREACAQGTIWRETSRDIGISVNLSARQLTAPGFTARVAGILAETGLPPAALTMEVNEQVLVADDGPVVGQLAELHRMGVRLAIDDFGTGYASLAHLHQLPLDVIKIDPSFVAGLGHDDTLTLLTRTVVQLGRELGLRVIAEGIEQPGQLSALREMGCHYGQGFLVGRPMAAQGVETLIAASAGEPGADEQAGEPGEPARLGM